MQALHMNLNMKRMFQRGKKGNFVKDRPVNGFMVNQITLRMW